MTARSGAGRAGAGPRRARGRAIRKSTNTKVSKERSSIEIDPHRTTLGSRRWLEGQEVNPWGKETRGGQAAAASRRQVGEQSIHRIVARGEARDCA